MATTSQPAPSAAAASLGPERSSPRRSATEVETVMIAVRMPGRLGVNGLGRLDEVDDAALVPRAQQLDRVRLAVDDALEERLAVLVGGQRRLGPAAGVVEQDGQARVGLAV